MDEISAKIMSSAKAMLGRFIDDGVLGGHDRTEAQLAVKALDFALARDAVAPAQVEALHALELALVDRFSQAGFARPADMPAGKNGGDWLASAGQELAALAATTTPRDERAFAKAVRDFLVSTHEPIDPNIAAGSRSVYSPVQTAARQRPPRVEITAAGLERYMLERFPDLKNLRITDFHQVQGGYSKATYIIASQSDAGAQKFVIRQDRPGLPTGSSVTQEFVALGEVFALGVPVPQPLWIEPDMRWFGSAVMAVSFREGEPGRILPTDPAVQQSWTLAFAELLAKLHRSSARPDLDARDIMRGEIAAYRARFAATKRFAHPGVEFGFAWLTDHIGDLAGRPVCRTHGDLAFHNVLVDQDKYLTALDWEFTHYCDPVEDVGYIKPFIDEFGLWNEFLEHYRANGGFSYDEKAARYFDVFNNVKITVSISGLLDTALRPEIEDVALINTGTTNLAKFEVDIVNAILRGDAA